MMTEDYCRDKAAPPGSNFYYSTLFHPQLVRLSLYTLHAFAIEIDQVITECSEPDLARIKLQWWHEELQRIYAGQARHPVGKSLALLIEQHSIPADHLHQFVTYTGQKLIQATPGSYRELMNFLQQGPGLLWQMSAEICTFNNAKTSGLSNELGCLIEIFYIIQNIYKEARQGRMLLPLDEMSNVGISPNDLTNMDNKKLIDFYIHQVKKLKQRLDQIYFQFPDQDRVTQLHNLIMIRLLSKTCEEITHDNINSLNQRIVLTPIRKLWIAWQTRHRAKKDMRTAGL